MLPAASRAIARRAWAPLVAVAVFQLTEYGALVSSAPRLAPSRVNWTPATPMLSAASALTGVVPERVAPAAGALTETVGGVVSGGGGGRWRADELRHRGDAREFTRKSM